MNDALRNTIEQYFASIRAGDRAGWLASFAPDGVSEDPAGTPPRSGYGELGAFWDGMVAVLSRMDFHATAVHVCGRRAAVAWCADLAAANGRGTFCEGIDLFEFDDSDRISRVTGYWDPAAAFVALGLGAG